MKNIFLIPFLLIVMIGSVESYTSNQFLAAKNLGEKGVIVKQSSLNLYRLDETMTRKEFMKVLANQVGEKIENECDYEFRDVKNDWGCKYIEWAMKKTFIAQDQYFRPNEAMTKAEAMKLILKVRNIPRIQKTSDWREDDMQTAYRKGIIAQKYSDYDTSALRGWIFEALATQQGELLDVSDSINTGPQFTPKIYKMERHKFQKDIFIWIN